jgi:hypothetical protein
MINTSKNNIILLLPRDLLIVLPCADSLLVAATAAGPGPYKLVRRKKIKVYSIILLLILPLQ